MNCPKHTTGGGPCYCGYKKYTLTLRGGRQVVEIARSVGEAQRMAGSPAVVGSKSEPWNPDEAIKEQVI